MPDTISGKYMIATLERDRIIKTMIIGFGMGIAAGVGLFSISKPDDILQCVYMLALFGFVLSGMPYMWLKLPKVYGILNPVSWVLIIIKLAISALIGLFYTPISLIVKIVQAKIYHKQVKEDQKLHPENYPNYNPAKC